MAKSTPLEIAATVLSVCNEREIPISNLKLQKLTYYVEAWYLALEGESLFNGRIQAWVHGPVIPQVFREYRHYRWSDITTPSTSPSIDPEILAHVETVIDAYGTFSATELERLTHSEQPWIEARKGYEPDEPCTEDISRETMKEFYSSKLES